MSYIYQDHAGWIELQIGAIKRCKPTAVERRAAADGKGWHAAPDKLTEFQRKAFTILGITAGGIYNAPIMWKSVYWGPWSVAIPWRGDLATWDFNKLTWFVFLCHEARIRGDISPKGFRHMEILLSPRVAEGGIGRRHPNLDEAVTRFREDFPADHPIVFKPTLAELEPAS